MCVCVSVTVCLTQFGCARDCVFNSVCVCVSVTVCLTQFGCAPDCVFNSVCVPGAAHMVSLGLVPRLVMKLPAEQEDIRALILATLSSCVRVDALPALASNGVSVLGEQLSHPSPDIRREAASAMMGIRSASLS